MKIISNFSFTRAQQRRRVEMEEAEAANGLRPKFRNIYTGANGGSFGPSIGAEISCDVIWEIPSIPIQSF